MTLSDYIIYIHTDYIHAVGIFKITNIFLKLILSFSHNSQNLLTTASFAFILSPHINFTILFICAYTHLRDFRNYVIIYANA